VAAIAQSKTHIVVLLKSYSSDTFSHGISLWVNAVYIADVAKSAGCYVELHPSMRHTEAA